MSKFWEMVNQEQDLIKATYLNYRDVFDFVIESWDHFITPHYFYDFKHASTPLLAYKVQADIAFKQAIASALRHEYSQAIYNIRLASECVVITLFCYSHPESTVEELKKHGSVDQRLRKKAIKFLDAELPIRSEKFKGLHQMCDAYGSHQNIGYAANHFKPDEVKNSFDILLIANDRPELMIGLTGIVIGTILEFDFAMSDLGTVDELKINSTIKAETVDILNRFEVMKSKYRYLYTNLV